MISNPLQIFGHHHHIDGLSGLGSVGTNSLNDIVPHLDKQCIHNIILLDGLTGQLHIGTDKGIDTGMYHINSLFCHLLQMGGNHRNVAAVQMHTDIRNICRLISDPLHIGDNFKGSRNRTKIPGHRLLAQQQFQAPGFNGFFHTVHRVVTVDNHFCQLPVFGAQGRDGFLDRLFHHCPHPHQIGVKLFQLVVKFHSGRHSLTLLLYPYCAPGRNLIFRRNMTGDIIQNVR